MASLDKLISAAARKHGVSENYLKKLIEYESKGDPNAVSPTGAKGLGQFTKGTAKEYGLDKRTVLDPEANIDATARLAKTNQRILERGLSRKLSDDELYLGHLQGASGARSGFERPSERAIDVFGRKNVRVNLPASRRGELDTITAKDFQDLHRGNFNRAGSPTPKGTIDIGDQPSLKTLNPPAAPKGDRLKPAIPLSQLAPTEQSNTMARGKYPGYDEAIKRSMTGNTENVVMDPSTSIPRATSIKGRPTVPDDRGSVQGRVQLAGMGLPSIRGPGGRMRANPLKPPSDPQKGLPKPEDVPGPRTGTTNMSESEIRQRALERQQGLSSTKEKTRREGSSIMFRDVQPGSSAPIQPKGVKTERISPALKQVGAGAAVGGTAAAGAGIIGRDPAVEAVERAINPPIDDTGGMGVPQQPVGPQPVTRPGVGAAPSAPYSPRAQSMDPNQIGGVLQQAAPVIKEAMKDPAVVSAARVVTEGMVKAKARTDARSADMRSDPTFYQRTAAMQGGGGADPLSERAVSMGVARDYQQPYRRAAPPRGTVAAPQQASAPQTAQRAPQQMAKAQDRVPEELGDVDPRGLPPMVAQQFPVPPQPANVGPSRQMPQTPLERSDLSPTVRGLPSVQSMQPQMGVSGNPGMPPMMDPSMMQLMQFFTGGGGGVG